MLFTVTPIYSGTGIIRYAHDYTRLQHAGFHSEDASSIAWLGLAESLSGLPSDIADTALNIGPKYFDVHWYRKQMQVSTKQQWHDLVTFADHLDDLEKKEEATSRYLHLIKNIGKTGIALALFAAMTSVVQAQDMQSSSFSLQTTELSYTLDTNNYTVRLVGVGDKINQAKSVNDAIYTIQDDSTYAILLVSAAPTKEDPYSDFSEQQMRGITTFLEEVHKYNPLAIKKLEPIIVRSQPGVWSAALMGRDNFRSVIEEYVGKPYEGQYYGDIMDIIVGDLGVIPTSEEEHRLLMGDITEKRKSVSRSLDVIILGDDASWDISRTLYHELLHQLMKNFSTEEVKQEFASALPTFDVISCAGPYAKTQVKKVDEWVRRKKGELEQCITLCANQITVYPLDHDDPNSTLTNVQRTRKALETMSADQLRELYAAQLQNAVFEYKWLEPIAEVGADVVSNNETYRDRKRMVRQIMQDHDSVRAIRVNLAYDQLDEAQKFSIDHGLCTPDELMRLLPPLDDSSILTDKEIAEITTLLLDKRELERIATLRLHPKHLSIEDLTVLKIQLSVQMSPITTQHDVLERFLHSIK